MFASELISEIAVSSTVIGCEKAGVPSSVTIALALLAGTSAGVAADNVLLKGGSIKLDDLIYEQYWKQKELLIQSSCSNENLYEYLYRIDPNKAINFASTGKWPSDIQIPKNSSVLSNSWGIDWNQLPNGGYALDQNGNAIKIVYQPKPGEIIDRYGPANGRYTSPVIDGKLYTYDQRSLPYLEDAKMYSQYKVTWKYKNIQSYIDNYSDLELKADIESYIKSYGVVLDV